MRKSIHLLLLFNIALLFGCEKNSLNEIDPTLLSGTWRLSTVTFNGIDGNSINNWVSNSTILNLRSDHTYFRNYVVGEWEFRHQTLALNADESFRGFDWEYEILEVTEDILSLRILLSEGEYCCDFDQFEDNDVLIIEETYQRSE